MDLPEEIWHEILEYLLIPTYMRTCRLFHKIGEVLLHARIDDLLDRKDYDIHDAELMIRVPSLDSKFSFYTKRIVEIVVDEGRVDLLDSLSGRKLAVSSWLKISSIDYSTNMDSLAYAIVNRWIDAEAYTIRAIEMERKDILQCIIDSDFAGIRTKMLVKKCHQFHKSYLLDGLLVRDR